MNTMTMLASRPVAPETEALTAYVALPGFGIVCVNAYLIRSSEPVLIDTGVIALRDDFMRSLRATIAPEELRWIWLTHTDPDHVGSVAALLDEAPNARLVTTYLGFGKLGLQLQVPPSRTYLLNPGQSLDVGDRSLVGVVPPVFDAPESTAVFDTRTRVLFSSDCFGALLHEPADDAGAIAPEALRDGSRVWATVDAPWLSIVQEAPFLKRLDVVRTLAPSVVLSSHLPPARGMNDTLLALLASARTAPSFVGPDQAALTRMLAAAA